MSRQNTSIANQQLRAWQFYGVPGSGGHAVGEVHYVNAWLADQMTRLDWDVEIDGSPIWKVDKVPGRDTPVTTTVSVTDADGNTTTDQDQTAASAELLSIIDWDDTNVRAITTNLFVAGQGDYIFDFKEDRWRVVSVIERDRQETIKKAQERTPFIWPHPADPSMPDAPLFSVLELLEELDWLNRQGRAQSHQRVMINGILATADGFDKPGQSTVWDAFNNAIRAKMADPDDLSPVRISGALDLIKDGVNWIIPPFGYDDVLDRRVLAAINRLAYGLPVPPEILLGMQAQSRATAFQVEENAYRAHIEPPAWMIAQVAEETLTYLLDGPTVKVIPNPTNLLGRRNSVEDTKWAFNNKLTDGDFTREVLGIPEDSAPEAEVQQSESVVAALDLVKSLPSLARNPGISVIAQQIEELLQGNDAPVLDDTVSDAPAAIAKDPANVAADEGVNASADPLGVDLSTLLADIDAALSSELAGATAMATDRARQRLGAAARVNKLVRTDPNLKGLSNPSLASHLGIDGLTANGVDVAAQITEPLESVAAWWERRVLEAWAQMGTLIPGWSGQPAWVATSSNLLVQALTTHVVDTLNQPVPPPLEAVQIRSVLDAAAGGS